MKIYEIYLEENLNEEFENMISSLSQGDIISLILNDSFFSKGKNEDLEEDIYNFFDYVVISYEDNFYALNREIIDYLINYIKEKKLILNSIYISSLFFNKSLNLENSKLNFFTEEYHDFFKINSNKNVPSKKYTHKLIFFLLVFIFTILFFLNFTYLKKISILETTINEKKELLSLEEKKFTVLTKKFEELNQGKEYVKNSSFSLTQLLKLINSNSNPLLHFETLEINSSKLHFKGSSEKLIYIYEFEKSLNANGFYNINNNFINKINYFNFSVEATLKENEKGVTDEL